MASMRDSDDDSRPPEAELRRARMRCWRRGVREMDLILGGWFDAHADALTVTSLARLEALMSEDDPGLYAWVSGREAPPERHAALIGEIRAYHGLG